MISLRNFRYFRFLTILGLAILGQGLLLAELCAKEDPPAKKDSSAKDDPAPMKDTKAEKELTLEEKFKARIAAFREKQKKGALAVAILTSRSEFFDGSGSISGKEGDPAPTSATPFEIGSITKVFTGILLSEAVERGELRLDEPLGKILPDWKFPEFDTRQITAIDLTTHTSGLPPVPLEVTARAIMPWLDPYETYTVDKLKKDMGTLSITRPPGASQAYSNLGVGLLGTILTLKANKERFTDLVKERILDPWGMKKTVPNIKKLEGRPAAFNAAGLPANAWTFDALGGAGCLASTTEDLLIFSRKFLDPRDKKTVLARVMRNWRDLPSNEQASFQTKSIGFGAFQAKAKGRNETIYWHNGGTGGFCSFWAVVPEKKIAVVILCSVADRKVDRMGIDLLLEALKQDGSAGK